MPTTDDDPSPTAPAEPRDFLRTIVAADLESGKHTSIRTRFPPEPNGYLHIGHAKSIALNFGVARENGGTCNLRFDDTNPLTEDMEYAEAIQDDIRWLGFEWDGAPLRLGLLRGALRARRDADREGPRLRRQPRRTRRSASTAARSPSPAARAPTASAPWTENLDLLRRMRAGEFPDGAHVLRAKIDLAADNMKMRDPLLYRIRHAHHYRTGDDWCIYPMYDFTHCLSDSFERITHSFCTLEFENNREIYDWILEAVDEPVPRPRQIEFARLNLSYTVLSKRRLLQLVTEGHVDGLGRPAHADDPRPAPARRDPGRDPRLLRPGGHRPGGQPGRHGAARALDPRRPEHRGAARALRAAAAQAGDRELPEGPADRAEELDAPYFPHDVGKPGSRTLPFSRGLWIERDDFAEEPPKRLPPPLARAGGAAALRLLRALRRGREGPGDGRGDRGALHLRPGDPRRLGAGRPQGRRGRSTGSPPRTRRTWRCASTTACSPSRARRAGPERGLPRPT